jgi:hypothetical protein
MPASDGRVLGNVGGHDRTQTVPGQNNRYDALVVSRKHPRSYRLRAQSPDVTMSAATLRLRRLDRLL